MPTLPFRLRVSLTIQAHRIGYYATRQHALNRGGNMHDVAWILSSLLLIQGA